MSRAARSCPRSESDVLADLGLASFKPAQQAAHRMLVGAISSHRALARPCDDNTSCIVVLPTSSGKDLLSFSVARAFSGTTICFHPLKSLTEAAIVYGRRFNCTVTVLTAAGGIDRVGCSDVVVAAYEQAGDLMIGLCQTLAQKGRLCMTVFNEAHAAVRFHTYYYLPLPPHSSFPIPLSLLLLFFTRNSYRMWMGIGGILVTFACLFQEFVDCVDLKSLSSALQLCSSNIWGLSRPHCAFLRGRIPWCNLPSGTT
jgi:hypothetical protein